MDNVFFCNACASFSDFRFRPAVASSDFLFCCSSEFRFRPDVASSGLLCCSSDFRFRPVVASCDGLFCCSSFCSSALACSACLAFPASFFGALRSPLLSGARLSAQSKLSGVSWHAPQLSNQGTHASIPLDTRPGNCHTCYMRPERSRTTLIV